MDQSYSGSDISMSPSQILERLQVLRQLQLMQRGKLQKQRLQYQESSENSSSITEIVSHFSNSTSYNTFRSLLQSSCDISSEVTPRHNTSDLLQKVKERDLIEGVSLLNLSQESEFVVNSPVSSTRTSAPSRVEEISNENSESVSTKSILIKHISLDEMPILSPKKDFESLINEKLQNENNIPKVKSPINGKKAPHNKRPFLKRGEGMARFGLKKNDLIIQNTKALPWKRKSFDKAIQSPIKALKQNMSESNRANVNIVDTEQKSPLVVNKNLQLKGKCTDIKANHIEETENLKELPQKTTEKQKCESINPINRNLPLLKSAERIIELPKGKHPLQASKGKTWAAVLTKEQNDFLTQLKQSDYYKNFASPSKSIVSDASCDENIFQTRQERETAEQNMFELVENKVCNESFNLENSFFTKFFKRNKFECSGESTPLIMQKCLVQNPGLMHIVRPLKGQNAMCQSDAETCDYTDCTSDACSSVSSCCSCKTVETPNDTKQNYYTNKKVSNNSKDYNKKEVPKEKNNDSQNDTVTEDNVMKANMADMNAKLVTTSELLKERLSELEDEIETFRKENANLIKHREDVELERQKFYEEKNAFEQKFNEEKILSEYYLAEEKEKLNKQKQMYERYVREMRGRLNKKDKDEVVNLKKEICDLKEEIRLKDAKSTSTIARLRNQLKISEKEKKDLQDQVEKLKKENRRIQHSNDMTRRLTNMKYLAEINKKLTNMTSKETRSEINIDPDMKYKAFEIERQSRSRKAQPVVKNSIRPRAKSVPNLKVTSRYAKYFSQRDAASSIEPNFTLNSEPRDVYNSPSDEEGRIDNDLDDSDSIIGKDTSDTEADNHLEKLYQETFRATSPKSTRSNPTKPSLLSNSNDYNENIDGFFIRKSNSNSLRDSKSPAQSVSPYLTYSDVSNRSKSPIPMLSHKSSAHVSPLNSAEYSNISGSNSLNRSKSPCTSNPSSLRSATVIHKEQYRDKLMMVSPEPSTSKSSLVKTNLNPTEIRKPDGSKELKFPNGNVKHISADGKYSKFIYYNGDVKENFYSEGRVKYFYSETKTYHTTHADGLEVLEFPDGQVEKRYKDGSSEIRLPNGSVRYFDPKNKHVREEWRFPDGAALTVAASGEQRILFSNGQVEVHAKDHKRREFPDGTVKLVYKDGTSETRYASGRVRIKDKHGTLIMDSAPG